MIPVWLFGIVLAWALAVTIFWLVRNPLPFPDRGHRCFAVADEKAAGVVLKILSFVGLPERFTFHPGPTHQTVLWDNTTVIIRHDQEIKDKGLPPNALSVVVPDPRAYANEAALMLIKAGFTATVHADVLPEVAAKFVMVTSDAFDHWGLAFRRHVLVMGPPPKKE
jgi:hypothetical protein